ncbi:MAG: hypothetical protein BJ554DRAFT_938 [Olpidium bornovanus]|uniref:Uncharacterized protein n=1 Tax=Olpidium bornovanus TaxID=278681 RepID=A0A8H8A1H3_9FUNG|nr:MAG: hypothetical protein BJ554DRAFT_938 [Olpidium bornovanus]
MAERTLPRLLRGAARAHVRGEGTREPRNGKRGGEGTPLRPASQRGRAPASRPPNPANPPAAADVGKAALYAAALIDAAVGFTTKCVDRDSLYPGLASLLTPRSPPPSRRRRRARLHPVPSNSGVGPEPEHHPFRRRRPGQDRPVERQPLRRRVLPPGRVRLAIRFSLQFVLPSTPSGPARCLQAIGCLEPRKVDKLILRPQAYCAASWAEMSGRAIRSRQNVAPMKHPRKTDIFGRNQEPATAVTIALLSHERAGGVLRGAC